MERDDKPHESRSRRPFPTTPDIVDDHKSIFGREPRKDWRMGVTLEAVLQSNLVKVDPNVTVTPVKGAYEIMLSDKICYEKANDRIQSVVKHYIGFLPESFEVERMPGGYRIII